MDEKMKALADEMFGTPVCRPVPTAESKAVGVLEDYFNNPYLVGLRIPRTIVVRHNGEYVSFNAEKLMKKYGYK